MSNVLTDEEIKRLAKLGEDILMSLSCNANNMGVPCRTDRLEAVKLMREYLEIHGYTVKESEA